MKIIRCIGDVGFKRVQSVVLTKLLLGLALVLIASIAQASSGDAKAFSLVYRAEQLLNTQNGRTLDSSASFKQREAILIEATALEAASAASQAPATELSVHARAQLTAAMAELESLGVAQTVVETHAPSQVLANGSITGVVRDATTNLPLAANSIRIQATNFSSQLIPNGVGINNNAPINANGEYTLSLPPGAYQLRTLAGAPNLDYVPQVFGFGNCIDLVLCTRYVGTIVIVADGGAAVADFSMPIGARISGNLKRADTQANVANAQVLARPESGGLIVNSPTDVNGNYTLRGLAPGRYRVITGGLVPSGFLNTVYPNVQCGDIDCETVPGSTLVTVAGTATTSGIDLVISPGAGAISGTITETGSGNPVVDTGNGLASVYLINEDRGTFMQSVLTAANGSYSFIKLRPGNYRVVAVAPGLIGKVVLGLTTSVSTRNCNDPNLCDALDIGGAITVAPGATVSNVSFSLDPGASVSGTVRTAVGALPIVGATVSIGNSVDGSSAVSDASGNFTVRGLAPGVYYASVDALPRNFVQTWLGDVACRGFECINIGRPITIFANTSLTGVNFNMPVGGTLTGMILDGVSGVAAPRQARLELFTANSRTSVVQVFTTGVGGYSATGLPPGAYKAVFASDSVLGWVDTAFGGLPCPRASCDLSLLPTLAVSAGSTTANVGVSLPRGPMISGRITDAATGLPIRPLAFGSGLSGLVAFNSNLSNYAGFARVSLAGTYLSRTGLPPGAYFLSSFLLRNNTTYGGGYIDQTYNNITCPFGSCGLASGNAINVNNVALSGFDIALNRGAAITGTVTAAFNGAPLFGVDLTAFNSAGKVVATKRSNPNGKYRLDGLPSGSYFVTTQNAQGFQDALYTGQICEPFCNPVSGTPIVVSGTATTSGRDFVLQQLVSVGGVVSDGAPAANVPVALYGQIGNFLAEAVTTSDGSYLFDGLAPGRFYVRTRNATGRTDDLYWQANNAQNTTPSKPDCVGLACQVRRGTPIDLASGSSFSSANLALSAPGSISGQITNANGSAALSGVAVELLDARGIRVASVSSSASGSYSFNALGAGNYYLVTRGSAGFVDIAYPNNVCPAACNGLNGNEIAVALGANVNNINMSLSSGASISGVLRDASNLPIPGMAIQVYNAAGIAVAQVASNLSGSYSVNNLANGQYFVRTQSLGEAGSSGFVNKVYNNRACGAYCDVRNGDAVSIASGNSVSGIDFSLSAGGTISGTLSSALTSTGIALAEVHALDANGQIAARTRSSASGNFTLGGLPAGSYKLRTSNSAGYINQVYRSASTLSCSPNPCALSLGTAITLSDAGSVNGINFSLSPGGTISGTAADLFNNPLSLGSAVLLDAGGLELATQAISSGNFEFNGLSAGSYYVLIRNDSGLVDVLFPNLPCPGGACDIVALGTPIVLGANRVGGTNQASAVANIDLRLSTGRAISGQVTANSAAIAGVTVYFFNANGAVVASGVSDALGNYVTRESLPAGSGANYFAATASPNARGAGGGLINKAWSNVVCMQDCGVVNAGTAIALPTGVSALSGINFDLSQGGGLRGTIRNSGGSPLAQVAVEVFDSSARLAGTALSDSLGNYVIDGLAPGDRKSVV